ncbi:nuclear factor related to kappa-B-binding protein isoform X2 [Strongylocentrotus purpuratus]|uniref:DEUBAD domain-containing protein n=1 Tax=Strongylocentrotus purpuratus TaxID=7668 RepID=A0A7M7NDL3_STRPU|nr:nuclear factor related to kappa-B-binding protein isoform X2 [Strongylocentrotus purpuratus]
MTHLSRKTADMESKRDGANLTFEPCILGKAKVWLPVDLIEDPCVFKSVMSQETWDSSLTGEERDRLMKLMPQFPEDDEKEKQETLRCLFERENFMFGNPLTTFEERLRAGFMNPEIVEVERGLRRATYKDYKFSEQRRLHRLLKEVLISRQELLEAAIFTSPSAAVPVKRRLYRNDKAVDAVVDKKYRKMLASAREGDTTPDSSDEGESKPEMNGFHRSPGGRLSDLDLRLDPKWTDFWPQELDQEEEVRTHSTFDPKPVQADGNGTPGKTSSPTKPPSPVRLSQQQYIKLIENYQDRIEDEHLRKHPELNTKHITVTGIISRAFPTPPPPQLPIPGGMLLKTEEMEVKTGKKRKDREKDRKKRKKKKMAVMTPMTPPKAVTPISIGSLEGNSPVDILSTPESRPSTRDDFSTSPATCSPASAGSSSSDIKPPLRVHPSFFSLIRDIFSAAPSHRLTLAKLRESLANWQRSPVSMLSTWAILQPSWAKVVDGAMRFLNGEVTVSPEVIPRVRYDEERQMWQWRSELPPDSEEELVTLFKQWLDTLPGMRAVPPIPKELDTSTPTTPSTSVPQTVTEMIESKVEVKPSFAEQERERYSQPHKAFVYKMADYEAVVAPVKGVFGKETTPNKAREHALLISDRPSYVTILSLVRDAVARLPNGEGTRAAVCELLKDSQYLADSSDSQINNVVSGALDRLHYEKDPCIKYDVNRKLWIYLHKERTKEEFERLHMEQGAEAKARKSIARQTKLLPKMTSGLRDSPISFQASRPGSAMSDASSENLSIEVCSPKASPGRASSPKASRKSPAFAKMNPVPGFPGGVDLGRGDRPVSSGSVSTTGGKIVSTHAPGQAPFVISPQKIDSLQSALRGLHQSPATARIAGGDNLIRAQLLAARASEGSSGAFGAQGVTMYDGTSVTSVADILKGTIGSMGDMSSRTSTSGFQEMPKFVKSMSVPCTLPDGKVVMISPELLMPSGKPTKKRARSGSGGRKKGNAGQSTEGAVTLSGASDLSKLISSNIITPSSVTVSQGTSKTSRKSVTPSPTSVTLGTNKLATVSEALAQKRAEAALQSGRQQSRGQSTITLPPGALKGQTVKSILASVGIPLSGASVTVSRIDTPGSSSSAKQGSTKSKDSRKSPVFSGVNILGSQPATKGRPSSAPSMSGKKSPITSMHHALGHQTIGLTTVTKGGQVVVQPVALGIERPGSAASPGIARQSSSPAAQALTLKAIPVSLAKKHGQSASQDSRKMPHQITSEAVGVGQDDHDGSGKKRMGKGGHPKQHFVSGNAAAALAQAGKMSAGTELKDFASVPLSLLFPGSRQGGNQKGGLPLLTSPFLTGGQIPIASLTDGKGVVFQMPHGSNLMSLPMSGVPVNPQRSGAMAGSPGGQSLSSSGASTTTVSAAQSARQIHHHLSQGGSSAKTSPALPSNIVTATIRSALAAAQNRANPHQGLSAAHLSQWASQQSTSGSMKADMQSVSGRTSQGASMMPSHMTSTSGGMPSQYNFPPSGSRSRMPPSPSESKTSLTASSIASIIANLKQNPMAAISLPSVSSFVPSANVSRSMSQSSMQNQPVYSQGFIRAQMKQSAASKTTSQPAASPSHPQSTPPRGAGPTLARSLSQPSSLFPQMPSAGFTRDLSRMQSQSTTSAPSSASQVSRSVLQTAAGSALYATASNPSAMGVSSSRISAASRVAVQSSASTATLKSVPMQPTSEIPPDVKPVTQAKQRQNPGIITTSESKFVPSSATPAGTRYMSTGNTRLPAGVKPVSTSNIGTPTGTRPVSTGNNGKTTGSKTVSTASAGMPTGSRPISTPVTGSRPIPTPVTGSRPISTPVTGSRPISTPVTGSRPISTPVTGSRPISTPVTGSRPISTPVTGSRPIPTPVTAGTTGSTTQVSAAPPQRVIPPLEPRVTRGKSKGKAAVKKEES